MPSVGPLASGFSQSASAYLTIVSDLTFTRFLTYTPGTGSGGAALPGSFAPYNVVSLGNTVNLSTSQLKAGNMLKDMGKTVVSTGRVFRKVQVMAAAGNPGISGGSVSAGTGDNFLTGYLEVASDAGDTPNSLARF